MREVEPMPDDAQNPVPSENAPAGDDADAELFFELLAEQRY